MFFIVFPRKVRKSFQSGQFVQFSQNKPKSRKSKTLKRKYTRKWMKMIAVNKCTMNLKNPTIFFGDIRKRKLNVKVNMSTVKVLENWTFYKKKSTIGQTVMFRCTTGPRHLATIRIAGIHYLSSILNILYSDTYLVHWIIKYRWSWCRKTLGCLQLSSVCFQFAFLTHLIHLPRRLETYLRDNSLSSIPPCI